jgi:putative MFS transporter
MTVQLVKPIAIKRAPASDKRFTGSLLDVLDSRPLDGLYWSSVGVLTSASIFDYFDFFLVSFLISVVGPAWRLTYAQTSIVLLAAGVGSIIGGFVCGFLSDRFGRKPLMVVATLVCGFSSGAVAFIPNGAWALFAVLRFFVGIGVAGVVTASGTLIVEYTPTRVRTGLSSALGIPVGVGILLASVLASVILPIVGWRGLAALGFIPIAFGVLALVVLPESARWLIGRGRGEEVRQRLSREMGIDLSEIPPAPEALTDAGIGSTSIRELWSDPRRFWLVVLMSFGLSAVIYGVLLWGPTIVSMLLEISPAAAAKQFILITIAGVVGRVIFAAASMHFGRRRCGQVAGFAGALCLCGAGVFHGAFLGAIPAFVIFLIVGSLFYDGVTVIFGPWPAEIFPVRLAARGMGLSQSANALGKIAGPLCLALLAGSNNLVAPKATQAAVLPAFLFLAACCLLVGLVCTLIPIETHRRALVLDDRPARMPAR